MKIVEYQSDVWAKSVSEFFLDEINAFLKNNKRCNVMLTGGATAENLYLEWGKNPKLYKLRSVRFYLSDERFVALDHKESNYGMVSRSLFVNKIPADCYFYPIEAKLFDQETTASRYEKTLPEQIDILILAVGEDGHIASLFPGSEALKVRNRLVMPVISPKKKPYQRLTITPQVISRAKSIFIIATGSKKAKVLCKALSLNGLNDNFPLSYVSNATWLVDSDLIAESSLIQKNMHVRG